MPIAHRKKLALVAFAVAAGAVDYFAGTNFLPMALQALMGM
ncbi:hypothetical protein FBZ85_11639 [Azospirillum brasilense]|uniref:Uncharacterized protein n=1 Tax=Azospirillum baldaniorum TaxID=1064539 RepID=A0A9P1JT63_9PROT|nr:MULTISPECIES: hypothetical protein [Azospirillum]TWA73347.1 hypothetical protein FBZ85_11639 [Azospirillum brasilense]CCC99346.1 exported protein of unknown function [Azospirillum baldaniorum]